MERPGWPCSCYNWVAVFVDRPIGKFTTTMPHPYIFCRLDGFDHLCLAPTAKQYLHVIASRLGLPYFIVSYIIDPFLILTELVLKDDSSRMEFTTLGREHLARS